MRDPSPGSVASSVRVVRLVVAYDGTGFRGWARQGAGVRTVQGVLEDALGIVLRVEPSLVVAGRTDRGVHARGQVASFGVTDPSGVDLVRLRRAVNRIVGPEVVVREASWAPGGFHARFSATAREYRYRIDTGAVADPFDARFVWHRPGELRVGRMRAGARGLIGEHDFASFCRRPPDGGPTTRRVGRLTITRAGDRVEIVIRANAFCHQMVRSVVGTLVAVGAGKIDPADVVFILAARDRSETPNMAPAHGLTLERVVYGRQGPREKPRSTR